jgi:hypothetical protein
VAALCWDKALLMFLMVQEQDFRIVAAIALLLFVIGWSNRNFTNGCSYWTDDYGCHWNF